MSYFNITPIVHGGTGIISLGTGVQTALGNATNAASGLVTYSGALGTPTSGTLTSCTGLPLTTGVTGTLGVTNGGTGLTTLTAGLIPYGNGTSALSSSATLSFASSQLTIPAGTAGAPALISATGGSTTGLFWPAASTVGLALAGTEFLRLTSGTIQMQPLVAGRIINVAQTANTSDAGTNLTISAGDAGTGATDKAGGQININAGRATGTGNSRIVFSVGKLGTTGTTLNALGQTMGIYQLNTNTGGVVVGDQTLPGAPLVANVTATTTTVSAAAMVADSGASAATLNSNALSSTFNNSMTVNYGYQTAAQFTYTRKATATGVATNTLDSALRLNSTMSANHSAAFASLHIAAPLGSGITVDTYYGAYIRNSVLQPTTNTNAYGIAVDYGRNVFGAATSNACAQVEIVSTTQGFLLPRMTTTQKNAIASPVAGLMVYDTTLNKACIYTTTWETITSA
jgi:hypothetical protein